MNANTSLLLRRRLKRKRPLFPPVPDFSEWTKHSMCETRALGRSVSLGEEANQTRLPFQTELCAVCGEHLESPEPNTQCEQKGATRQLLSVFPEHLQIPEIPEFHKKHSFPSERALDTVNGEHRAGQHNNHLRR